MMSKCSAVCFDQSLQSLNRFLLIPAIIPTMQSYVCAECKGSTGLLLPLDPEVNPQHYNFLEAMERRQFGRQRRRVGRDPDPLTVGIQIAKTGLILFGTLKVLNSIAK